MMTWILASACFAFLRVVDLPSGDIPLTETRVLDAAYSDTLFRGAADGSTRLTGGVSLGKWKDRGDGVWETAIPRDAAERPILFETLFVNGRRATRSRYPEKGFFAFDAMTLVTNGVSSLDAQLRMRPKPELQALLEKIPPAELPYAQIIGHLKWDIERYPLAAFANGELVFDIFEMRPWKPWDKDNDHELENVRFAFRNPGDWFYDGVAGKVLYRPLPTDKITDRGLYPCEGLATLLEIRGDRVFGKPVHGITFENVTFAYSAPQAARAPSRIPSFQAAEKVSTAAVVVEDADRVVFRNCRFTHLGGYALWFRQGCRGGGAFGCEFTDLGAGGVRIGGQKKCAADSPLLTSGITIDDCLIAHGGRFFASGVGVLLTFASDCTITHNEIYDLYYTAISLGWVWGYAGSPSYRNEVSFNHIHDIGQRHLADMGGVYTLGTSFGTVISNNVIHAIHSASYGGWGLYNDEGSEGIVLENNLVYDTDDSSYHQHYGRGNILRNNILRDSGYGQIAVTRGEPHLSFTCERNLITWKEGPAFGKRCAGTAKEQAKINWASNVWWCASGETDFNGTNFTAWAARVGDHGSRFADPDKMDLEKEIGFRPFDPSLAGRRKK